jgi:Protein of unknown function (DUF1566)
MIRVLKLKRAFPAFVLAMASPLFAAPVHSEEESCGIVHKQRREPIESQRFWPLAEYGGSAFIDMRTCLVWRGDRYNDKTLSEAMRLCAELGQGGPESGEMGWQLPAVAELTSVDGKEWGQVPGLARSETSYWTSTPWLGSPGSWAGVTFSARTTFVNPLEPAQKAGVWCVRGFPARGLR